MSLKILEFETLTNKYVFDGKTGTVIAVDDILLNCIKMYEKGNAEQVYLDLMKEFGDEVKVRAAIAFVEKYKRYGAFYETEVNERRRLQRGKHFDHKMIENVLKAGYTQQLILNVTENCNMRCRYCYLSEVYKYTRNRTNEMMSEETAYKALDYYFEIMKEISKYNPGKKCAITFYGGEALMNFAVVKKGIEYAKKNSPVRPMFNITTNGMLLKGEIADYLVENDVSIAVSLDGTRNEQDRNRIDANGNGTFDIIMKNIKEFKKKYPTYSKINLSAVYDLLTNFEENDEFFESEGTEMPYVGMLSPVVESGTEYYKKFTEEDIVAFRKRYYKILDKYMQYKVENKELSSYLTTLFDLQFVNVLLSLRYKDRRLPILPFTGTCIPGMKISVKTNGKFEICEKMNQTFPIGDLENGLDTKAIAKIVKNYNNTIASNCVGCPINKMCGICFAQVCGNGEFEPPNCQMIINSFKMNLSIIYTILEKNSHAYDNYYYRDEWILNL